jgi:outer membrane protein TolC
MYLKPYKTNYIMIPIKIKLLAIALLFIQFANAQQLLTLKACYDSLERNYPLVNLQNKIAETDKLQQKIFQANYMPSIELGAKVTHQSDVTKVSLDFDNPMITAPEIAEPPLTQYSVTMNIKQILYDGGRTKAASLLATAGANAEKQQVLVDIYSVKDRINKLYFVNLLLQENTKIIELTREQIKKQMQQVESAVKNGASTASPLDNLQAALLQLDQQEIELQSQQQYASEALQKISCIQTNSNVEFSLPLLNEPIEAEFQRPEHALFEKQSLVLDANSTALQKNRMPTLAAFATAGYGNPALNMFNPDGDTYYIVGAQASWKVWDWKVTQREKAKLLLKKQMIVDRKETFDLALEVQLTEVSTAQEKYNKLLEKDGAIIEIRKKITKRSASALENGTKTSADYLTDLNAEKQARIQLATHKIQQVQNLATHYLITGHKPF